MLSERIKQFDPLAFQRLLDIGKCVLGKSNIRDVLKIAMDKAIEVTGAERGMIILFDAEGSVLFETARNLQHKDIENPRFETSRTIINMVKNSAEAVCLTNALEDPRLKKSASTAHLKILSVICLPLKFEGETFGVVYLDNRTVRGAFEAETGRFAEAFADFISLAAHCALERKRLQNRISALEAELRERHDFKAIIGHDPQMVRILKIITQITDSPATVLIKGESGTGKELIARALHYNSFRKDQPFVTLNCGAFQENLIESELFGHVKGAFTGAVSERIGWLERAKEGSIFLDEIAEMSPAMQVKLLRVLQSGEFSPVGSTEIRRTGTRIIAATHRNLAALVKENKFREDLFYRLNVIDIDLPALRERKGDLPLLIKHLLEKFAAARGKPRLRLAAETERLLWAYDYPGNIRELENILERAIALSEGEVIEPAQLPPALHYAAVEHPGASVPSPLNEAKHRAAEKAERDFISACLQAAHGHISNAAKLAGVDVSNFHKLVKKHGIDAGEFKKRE